MPYAFTDCMRRMTYACLAGWLITVLLMMRLPGTSYIRQELYQRPQQTPTEMAAFRFRFHHHDIQVVPQAEYALWGLVVSHNEPAAWYSFDISHGPDSPNTRDICVIWNSNLKNDAYRNVSYHSDDNFCLFTEKDGVHFNPHALANNHLITDNPEIRDRIAHLHIGDQVYIRGELVNYTDPGQGWQGNMRQTSLVRTDEGDGACEIIFVRDLQVLSSYNGMWAMLNTLCFWGLIGLIGLRCLVFLLFREPA